MSDLISRQAAIDAVDEQIKYCDKALASFGISLKDEYAAKVEKASLNAFKETLKYLPSAEPERKTGRWIEQDDGWDGTYYECSCCKEAFTLIDGTPSDNLYNYCPNCGAKMEE